MIAPMAKYSFLIFHRELDPFMEKLMDLGVVHLISRRIAEDAEVKKQSADIALAEQVLQTFRQRKKTKLTSLPENPDFPRPTVADIPELQKELESLEKERAALQVQIQMLKPWGEFSWDAIRALEQNTGMALRFCRHQKRKFREEWYAEHPIEIVHEENGFVYFIIFQRNENKALPVVPLALPHISLGELEQHLTDCEKKILAVNQALDFYAATYTDLLREGIDKAWDRLRLHQAHLDAESVQHESLILVEGWCPEFAEETLQAFLQEQNIVYAIPEVSEEERPPVLLRNNRFARLFEPIGRLYALPDYRELDLTVFFAPFFFLFFGFCLGDAGYGAVFLIAGTVLKLKIKGPFRDYLTLVQLFGVSTMLMGYLSGTLFGLTMAELPVFTAHKNIFLNQIEMLQLALAVGLVQILFGMGVQVYKQVRFRGWKFGMSKMGWIILCVSLLDLYVTQYFTGVSSVMVWIGVALIVFFGSPESGWLKSFGMGLTDLYNITGVMGDLLSYIRLFALGVSSAILGLVVNSIALSAKGIPYIGILLFIVVLVIGHTANLLLASLSAFVHPMRLTFVEFYKNTGFTGGGKPYTPLARKAPGKS